MKTAVADEIGMRRGCLMPASSMPTGDVEAVCDWEWDSSLPSSSRAQVRARDDRDGRLSASLDVQSRKDALRGPSRGVQIGMFAGALDGSTGLHLASAQVRGDTIEDGLRLPFEHSRRRVFREWCVLPASVFLFH